MTSSAFASIGEVIEQVGATTIERKAGDKIVSEEGSGVESYDTIRTKKGKTAIQFLYTIQTLQLEVFL